MTPPAANDLGTAKRAQASRRRTAVLTTAGTGLVIVALAARLGQAAAIAAAVFAGAAVAAAAWRAAAEDRRWRHAFDVARTPAPASAVRPRRRRPTHPEPPRNHETVPSDQRE